ncbi:hypothetical protein ACFL96_04400 [Thermoproteota archaeon]
MPFLAFYFFESETVMIASIGIVLACHHWSVFLKLGSQKRLGALVWGIYSFCLWPLVLVYPVGYLVFSLLFNSWLMGFMVTIFMMFFVFAFSQLSIAFIPLNLLIFILSFFAIGLKLIFLPLREPYTILSSFERRKI